jgi:hypothetical protein
MLFIRLFLAVMAGLAGHRAYTPSQLFGPRWGSMLRYAIGLIIFIPCNIIIKKSLPDTENDIERDLVAGLLTAGALGTGTLLGHFLDGMGEK